MADSPGRNHYELLQVPRTASPAEIKASYHRLLLSHHPDKVDTSSGDGPAQTDIDIGLLKEAFVTLFSPESRIKYDSELSSRPDLSPSRSRPAHIVSLEDFDDLGQVWAYKCRCGGQYTVEEEDMEKGVHLVACSSCSEVIWAGYEVCPSDHEDTNLGES
jgi:diphthamide biosynthesis protein 4